MRTRRPQGTGCYDKTAEGLYRWRIGVYNPIDGKTHYKCIKAKTRAALDEKVKAWLEENGGEGEALPPLPKRMTVSQWVDFWLADVEGKKAPATIERYEMTAERHIKPLIGGDWIGKVSPLKLQAYFNELSKNHASATVTTIRDHFSACFEKAAKLGIIAKNPVKMTDSPRKTKPEPKVLEENEVSRILEIAKNGEYRRNPIDDAEAFLMYRNYIIILLAVASGMRQGEILGLTWPCVDIDGAQVRVKHSLQNLPGARVLKPPKNGRPRTIEIPASVAADLAQWREFQKSYAEKYKGIYENPLDLVFSNAKGDVVNGHRLSSYIFQSIARTAGIIGSRFHDLRHFWGSFALAHGVSIMIVSEQMGHSSIDVTLRIYTHVLKRSRDELRFMLDNNPLFITCDNGKNFRFGNTFLHNILMK